MAIGNELDGMMKFVRIHRWKPCLSEVLTDHFADPIADYGVEYEDLADAIGEAAFASLWNCAFEDFLTLTFEPDGANPIEDYLKRNGWKEKAANRFYLRGLQASVMSLYEVGEVVPGESLLAHDLIRPDEPVLVTERALTHHLRSGDRIAARIVDIGDSDVFASGVLPFSIEAATVLLEDLGEDDGPMADDDLAELAPVISNAWLLGALSEKLGPLPDFDTNSDGESLLLHEVSYELAEGAQAEEVAALLDGSNLLERIEPGHWRWVDRTRSDDPDTAKAHFPEMQEDGSVILAGLTMDDGVLELTANSVERAERAMASLGELLPGMLAEPVIETTSLEDMADEYDDEDEDLDEPPALTEEFVYNMLAFQLRTALDEPGAMLDGVTPRAAAQTEDGRKKLVGWLNHLEDETATQTISGVPMARYDFGWVWRELGIEALRR